MEKVAAPFPEAFLSDDLFKPVFAAAWTGLIFSLFEGTPKGKRLTIFAVIVLAGSVYLIHKRQREADEE